MIRITELPLPLGYAPEALRQAILDFEPRILPDSLVVEAVMSEDQMDRHNQIGFRISGQLWAQPVPLELLLRTQLDLEGGKVEVRDLTPGASLRPADAGAT